MEEMVKISQIIDFRYSIHHAMQIVHSKLQEPDTHSSYFLITLAGQTRKMHEDQLERKSWEINIWQESQQTKSRAFPVYGFAVNLQKEKVEK